MTPALRARFQIFRLGQFWVVLPHRIVFYLVLINLCMHRIQVELIPLVRMILGHFRRMRLRAWVIVRGLGILLVLHFFA